MPINFVQLLQESWNFMRNQSHFALFGVILLVILQLISHYLFPQMQFSSQEMQDPDAFQRAFQVQLLPLMISGLISVFVNVLIVLNIKSINNGAYHHFFQNLGEAGKRIFPSILLTILMVMPLSLAVSLGSAGLAGSAGILVLPLMIVGLFVFVKLCLVVYVYLLEEPQKGVGESVKFMWQMSAGKSRFLVLFVVIAYFVPSMLSLFIGRLLSGEMGMWISQGLGAALSLFLMIFAFRFYQVFRALPNQ